MDHELADQAVYDVWNCRTVFLCDFNKMISNFMVSSLKNYDSILCNIVAIQGGAHGDS